MDRVGVGVRVSLGQSGPGVDVIAQEQPYPEQKPNSKPNISLDYTLILNHNWTSCII